MNTLNCADARRKIDLAAIVAGGLGARLGRETANLPKALVDVCGQPFIAHQLRLLRRNGIDRVVICAGHLGEMIQETVGDGAAVGMRVEYSFEGPRLLGTGGALRKAVPLLSDAFFVLYGDSYLDCDYAVVERAFLESGKSALMTVFRNENRWGASNVEFRDGRIIRHDKTHLTPAMQHIDYGLGVFRRSVFEALGEDERVDLADVYRDLLRRDDLAGYEVDRRFYEIGSPEGLAELRAHLAQPPRQSPANV